MMSILYKLEMLKRILYYNVAVLVIYSVTIALLYSSIILYSVNIALLCSSISTI